MKSLQAADALLRLQPAIDRRLAVNGLNIDAHDRSGQKVRQMLGHANGSGTGSTAAVWRGKGLVQVDVQDIEAQVAGSADAQQRVQVGAIAINQPASSMYHLDHLLDVLFEETQRVGIGQHQSCQRVITLCFERREVQVAAGVGFDFHHAIPGHRRGRRVGSVRRIGDQDLVALFIFAVFMVGADHHYTGQFALRACCRLQGYRGEAGDLLQPFLQVIHDRQAALHHGGRLQRMRMCKTGQARGLFIDHRVVLHRARTQRVKPGKDAVIQLGEPRVMAQCFQLAQFGQREFATQIFLGQFCQRHIRRRELHTLAAGFAHLVDQFRGYSPRFRGYNPRGLSHGTPPPTSRPGSRSLPWYSFRSQPSGCNSSVRGSLAKGRIRQ